jgi:hypothetical protein
MVTCRQSDSVDNVYPWETTPIESLTDCQTVWTWSPLCGQSISFSKLHMYYQLETVRQCGQGVFLVNYAHIVTYKPYGDVHRVSQGKITPIWLLADSQTMCTRWLPVWTVNLPCKLYLYYHRETVRQCGQCVSL